MTTRTSERARPLPPEERRKAIIDATLPLLSELGAAITTRRIAEAAGIAEGTIFRVFPDKESLIQAAVQAAFDPAGLEAELGAVDPTLELEPRLVAAVEILQRRVARIFQLMSMVESQSTEAPTSAKAPIVHRPHEDSRALIALIEPDRTRFRLPPVAVARLLRGMTVSGTHPMFALDGPMAPTEIVSLLLDGVRARRPDLTPTEHRC